MFLANGLKQAFFLKAGDELLSGLKATSQVFAHSAAFCRQKNPKQL